MRRCVLWSLCFGIAFAFALYEGIYLQAKADYFERDSVVHLQVETYESPTGRKMRVRWDPVSSAVLAGKTRTKVKGDELTLLVKQTFFSSFRSKTQTGGSLDLEIPLPPQVKRVLLGKDGCEIWPTDLPDRTSKEDELKAVVAAKSGITAIYPGPINFDDYSIRVWNENTKYFLVLFNPHNNGPPRYSIRVSRKDFSILNSVIH